MAIASLRGGAIKKMLPHFVQEPGAWPQPKEVGHGNNIIHSASDTDQGTRLVFARGSCPLRPTVIKISDISSQTIGGWGLWHWAALSLPIVAE